MSVGPDPNEVNLVEQARRQINRLAEEIARLSEAELEPQNYYGEFLQRVLTAIAAPAGAIWLKTTQGNLQLQYQINMRQVGLDKDETSRESHFELLRQAVVRGQPGLLAPHSGLAPAEEGKAAPGNPTDYMILLAPIMVEKNVAGLVEIWQDPHRGPDAQRGFLQFVVRMAGLASGYTRNYQLRQITNQQQVWTQLEAFAKAIHGSLNPTEVAYLIANEGRRLVECDRISVAVREGSEPKIEAISGADVVERRSNLVQLLRQLVKSVLKWNEKLVFNGVKDDSLPPGVYKALDNYLAESNAKFLVVLPLRDESREADPKRPARSCLVMESFDPPAATEPLVARLDVVARHSASALYNAAEQRRIPFRFIWSPLAAVQDGLGGKAKAILYISTILAVGLITALTFVPYPLRMEAGGQLLPRERRWAYATLAGVVKDFDPNLKPGEWIGKDNDMILIYSSELDQKVQDAKTKLQVAELNYAAVSLLLSDAKTPSDKVSLEMDRIKHDAARKQEHETLNTYHKVFNALLEKSGYYWVKSPIAGKVLTSDFKEQFFNAPVTPGQPLIRIGYINPNGTTLKEWEIELKIPQKHIGQVLHAYHIAGPNTELDVDILLHSDPVRMYKGKLAKSKVAAEAVPDRTDNNENEPVVHAFVRISGDDIPEAYRIPTEQLVTGVAVNTRIRCGNRAMGYSLFYGVWEFFYEKVVFLF